MGFFDELAKQLEAMAAKTDQMSVQLALDDGGYLDRQCPAAHCARGFKVLWADEGKFAEQTWCTYCGHQGANETFLTTAQREHLQATAHEHVAQALHGAMKAAARTTPKPREKASGVSVTVHVPARVPRELSIPAAWDLMKLNASCDQCGCRFAGLGSPCFCPACGHRSADLTFEQTMRRLRVSIAKRSELEAAVGVEVASDIMASVLEDGLRAIVTAFESFAKDAYPRLAPTASTPPKNVFQRLQKGSDLWVVAGGAAFDAVLAPAEWSELQRYFQQRHVIVHCNGIVDAEYVRVSGDGVYREGQRLSIRTADVERMLDLVEKLVGAMRSDLPG